MRGMDIKGFPGGGTSIPVVERPHNVEERLKRLAPRTSQVSLPSSFTLLSIMLVAFLSDICYPDSP